MGRFNTSDAMYSRAIANESIGIGDHVITEAGTVARIDAEGGEGRWRVTLTDDTLGRLSKQRVAKNACTLALKATAAPASLRLKVRYRCLCGCEVVWMKPSTRKTPWVSTETPATMDRMGDTIKGMAATIKQKVEAEYEAWTGCVCGDATTVRGTECRTCGITILSYDVETVDPPTSPF